MAVLCTFPRHLLVTAGDDGRGVKVCLRREVRACNGKLVETFENFFVGAVRAATRMAACATCNWVFLVLHSYTQFVEVSVWSLMGLCGVVESVHIRCTRNCKQPALGGPVRALN